MSLHSTFAPLYLYKVMSFYYYASLTEKKKVRTREGE